LNVAGASDGVTGELPTQAGLLRVALVPGEGLNRIASVRFSGAALKAEGVLAPLEAALATTSINDAAGKIGDFCAKNPQALPGVDPEDLLTVLSLAFGKVRRNISKAPDPSAWKNPAQG
jgi:hypothetical protein